MRRKPVFLFAFADSRRELSHLSEEEKMIDSTFSFLKEYIRIEFIHDASLDDIYRKFNTYHNEVLLFHFGGHAGDKVLELHDQNARAVHLSTLIGMQKKLKLVFLNGCSTETYVEELIKKKTKAAIVATKASIGDRRAFDFSRQFYEALKGGKTLEESFNTVDSYFRNLEENSTYHIHPKNRSTGFSDFDRGIWEWALHNTAVHDVQQWGISKLVEQNPVFINDNQSEDILTYEKNKTLIRLIFSNDSEAQPEGLIKYMENIKPRYDSFRNSESNSYSELLPIIVEGFPQFISDLIQELFARKSTTEGRYRLQRLEALYTTISQFVFYLGFANLWDEAIKRKTKGGAIKIRDEYRNDFRNFFSLGAHEVPSFDYFWMLSMIGRIFNENNLTPIFPELTSLEGNVISGAKYYEAYRWLEQNLKAARPYEDKSLIGKEIEALCDEAEEKLGLILQKCSVLSQFSCITVRSVSADLPRTVWKVSYFPESKHLYRSISNIVEEERMFHEPVYDHSMIFYKRSQTPTYKSCLNLSPFIIDACVYGNPMDQSNVYFFNYLKENGALVYRPVIEGRILEISDFEEASGKRKMKAKYRDIRSIAKQFESLRKDIFDE